MLRAVRAAMNTLVAFAAASLLILPAATTHSSQEVQSAVLVPGTYSAVIASKGGLLQRIDLASKEVLKTQDKHAKASDAAVRILPLGSRLLAVADGVVALHDLDSLEHLASAARTKGTYPNEIAATGAAFTMVAPGGALYLYAVEGEGESTAIREVPLSKPVPNTRAAAFSPDGTTLAVASGKVALVYNVKDGAFRLSLPASATAHSVTFHGNDKVLVGWGEEVTGGPAGVDVFPVNSSERLATLKPGGFCPFGANTRFVAGYPDLGLVVFSVSSCGVITAFRDSTWMSYWAIDFGGGNPDALTIRRLPGTETAIVSGMTDSHACVISLATGTRSPMGDFKGWKQVQATLDGHFTIGVKDGELMILPSSDR